MLISYTLMLNHVCNVINYLLTFCAKRYFGGEIMPLEEQLDQATQAVTTAIKKKMLEKGWSQTELAETLRLNRGVVSRAINGDANPQSVETRKKIYKILGMEGE